TLMELITIAPDPQKFHRDVIPALLHAKILTFTDYDVILSKAILANNRSALFPFRILLISTREAIELANYLSQTLISKSNFFMAADFPLSLEALKSGAQQGLDADSLSFVLTDPVILSHSNQTCCDCPSEASAFRLSCQQENRLSS